EEVRQGVIDLLQVDGEGRLARQGIYGDGVRVVDLGGTRWEMAVRIQPREGGAYAACGSGGASGATLVELDIGAAGSTKNEVMTQRSKEVTIQRKTRARIGVVRSSRRGRRGL